MVIVILVLSGLIFGSFVNALVWRFHEQAELTENKEQRTKNREHAGGKRKGGKRLDASAHGAATASREPEPSVSRLTPKELSMVHGRSMCSTCHHPLAAKDLVPVLSWLWLKGKCRYCGVKIQDNPAPELGTAALFVISYLCWPLPLHGLGLFRFIVWLGFLVTFVALTAYDVRWFTLPNRIVFPLIGLAVLEVLIIAVTNHDWRFALSAGGGALVLFGLFYILFQVSAGAWIGGGDVKLAIALGLLAGSVVQSILLLFASSVIGTLFSIPQLLKGKNGLRAKVPYGPFLLAATVLVVLWGQHIIDWYTGLLR